VNLGNPGEMSILEFANRIRAQFGDTQEMAFKALPQDDPKLRRPDITKAKRVLGWEPKVSLDEGLAKTIEYFKARVLADQLEAV
jgi:nucleoside-diphosphate-sugar epimerase